LQLVNTFLYLMTIDGFPVLVEVSICKFLILMGYR